MWRRDLDFWLLELSYFESAYLGHVQVHPTQDLGFGPAEQRLGKRSR
jgi:hypothetical protein